MSSILQWIIFWLISENTESVYGSTHAVIGKYSELNPKDCGITQWTNGFDDMCFDWHKGHISSLMAGRDVTFGEAPWVVKVGPPIFINGTFLGHGTCSGGLIADQWVITAKHCIISENASLYLISSGYNVTLSSYTAKVASLHKYPNPDTDLALLRLESSANDSDTIKSICLPEAGISNKYSEYVMIGGWGLTDRFNISANKYAIAKTLQIGYRMLLPANFTFVPKLGDIDDYKIFNSSTMTFSVPVDNKSLSCKGDSGGPIWQYHLGRAVLIGTGVSFPAPSGVCEKINYSEAGHVRVANFINWIKNVTKLK